MNTVLTLLSACAWITVLIGVLQQLKSIGQKPRRNRDRTEDA